MATANTNATVASSTANNDTVNNESTTTEEVNETMSAKPIGYAFSVFISLIFTALTTVAKTTSIALNAASTDDDPIGVKFKGGKAKDGVAKGSFTLTQGGDKEQVFVYCATEQMIPASQQKTVEVVKEVTKEVEVAPEGPDNDSFEFGVMFAIQNVITAYEGTMTSGELSDSFAMEPSELNRLLSMMVTQGVLTKGKRGPRVSYTIVDGAQVAMPERSTPSTTTRSTGKRLRANDPEARRILLQVMSEATGRQGASAIDNQIPQMSKNSLNSLRLELLEEGLINKEGQRRGTTYAITEAGREALAQMATAQEQSETQAPEATTTEEAPAQAEAPATQEEEAPTEPVLQDEESIAFCQEIQEVIELAGNPLHLSKVTDAFDALERGDEREPLSEEDAFKLEREIAVALETMVNNNWITSKNSKGVPHYSFVEGKNVRIEGNVQV